MGPDLVASDLPGIAGHQFTLIDPLTMRLSQLMISSYAHRCLKELIHFSEKFLSEVFNLGNILVEGEDETDLTYRAMQALVKSVQGFVKEFTLAHLLSEVPVIQVTAGFIWFLIPPTAIPRVGMAFSKVWQLWDLNTRCMAGIISQ